MAYMVNDILRPETIGLAERLGVAALSLEVIEKSEPAPNVLRILFRTDNLKDIIYKPGQDLMFSVDDSLRRRYTIRNLNVEENTVEIDVVTHSNGPGARWALSLRLGDVVEAVGPRGKVFIDENATWHLFVGDETFEPAINAMTNSLTPEDVHLVVKMTDDVDEMLNELSNIELPAVKGHAYIAGEFSKVNKAKKLLIERGFDKSKISAKPYWRAGQSNEGHGEPNKK